MTNPDGVLTGLVITLGVQSGFVTVGADTWELVAAHGTLLLTSHTRRLGGLQAGFSRRCESEQTSCMIMTI